TDKKLAESTDKKKKPGKPSAADEPKTSESPKRGRQLIQRAERRRSLGRPQVFRSRAGIVLRVAGMRSPVPHHRRPCRHAAGGSNVPAHRPRLAARASRS